MRWLGTVIFSLVGAASALIPGTDLRADLEFALAMAAFGFVLGLFTEDLHVGH